MTMYVKRLPATAQKASSKQLSLDLKVDKEAEVDGIGMGVLSDGTPFLNQRGLARLCGVQNAHIGTISSDWDDDQKPRIAAIKKILSDRGLTVSRPHIEVAKGGRSMFAYTDYVCLAILEYYAFEAGQFIQPEAVARYRWLAGRSLREVIYAQVGYQTTQPNALSWQQFHDRVSLVYDSVPEGYFCVFKAIADVVVTLINSGAPIGKDFVPDISIGIAWSKHWTANNLSTRFGDRRQFDHNYPNYFPQSASNPQPAYCYPEDALGEFNRWMRTQYLPNSFPTYLKKKVAEGQLAPNVPSLAMTAIGRRGRSQLPN